MYSVLYSGKAIKGLQKLDKKIVILISNWIEKNLIDCQNPRQFGKPLGGDKKGYWRYRIGDYRLLVNIDDQEMEIKIIQIGHRRYIYR